MFYALVDCDRWKALGLKIYDFRLTIQGMLSIRIKKTERILRLAGVVRLRLGERYLKSSFVIRHSSIWFQLVRVGFTSVLQQPSRQWKFYNGVKIRCQQGTARHGAEVSQIGWFLLSRWISNGANQQPPAELGVWGGPLDGAGATSAGGCWFLKKIIIHIFRLIIPLI